MNSNINSWSKKVFVVVLVLFVLVLPLVSFAQLDGDLGSDVGGLDGDLSSSSTFTTIKNPISETSINGLVQRILEGVIRLGIPVVALAVIYSGFLFVSAQGNPEKISTAKKSLTYTLIGAGILLGAWAIAQLISETVLAL